MTLSEMIARAIELKRGNKEFALFYDAAEGWEAHIGNPTTCVGLGETCGEIYVGASTPEAAIAALIHKLEAA